MSIKLKANAIPVRAELRQYPASKREFLMRYVKAQLTLGFVRKAVHPEWLSAPLVVPKKPPAMFRLAMDNRGINAAAIQKTWPMPNTTAKLADTKGSTAYASMDFCSGYWQAALHEDSQALFASITHFALFMPTRTTQGGTDSAANFQEKMSE